MIVDWKAWRTFEDKSEVKLYTSRTEVLTCGKVEVRVLNVMEILSSESLSISGISGSIHPVILTVPVNSPKFKLKIIYSVHKYIVPTRVPR